MALYEPLMQSILTMIETQALREGDRIPNEIALSETYRVSRPTVRIALMKLVNDGYLKRVKGQGTFVTRPKITHESTQFIESFNDEMHGKGLTPITVVLEARVCPGSDAVCQRLGLPPKSLVNKLRRLRFVQAQETIPVTLTTVYISHALVPDLMAYDFEAFSLYEVLERSNLAVTNVTRELEIKLLHGKTANYLDAKEGSPAHFISSVGLSQDGQIIEYAESFYPAERSKFIIRVTR